MISRKLTAQERDDCHAERAFKRVSNLSNNLSSDVSDLWREDLYKKYKELGLYEDDE